MSQISTPTARLSDSLPTHWHDQSAQAVIERLATDPEQGLSTAEAQARLERLGPNRLTQQGGTPMWLLFLKEFNQPLIYILLGASVITAFLNEWVDSIVIFGVVLVNAVIGFIQEVKAMRAIEALTQGLSRQATVIRDGEKQQVEAGTLVPGDLVMLAAGDKVPADLRLLRRKELQIDEAPLTGESVPVFKQLDALPADTVLGERTNLAFSSTLATYGTGVGVVVRTGNDTEIGRINQMIASADVLATPLTKQIDRFSQLLLYVILGLAAITVVIGLLRGQPFIDTFMAAIALAVGAIPEGLPAALTIILAIGVSVMAERRAIVRKLPAVETLGSTSVICSDKTGTLTQNQMTVQEIRCAERAYEVTGLGYVPEGQFKLGGQTTTAEAHPALHQTLLAGLLCNDSILREEEGQWRIEGDPTEGALLVSARKAGLDGREWPRLDEIPFESAYQYMATLHRHDSAGGNLILVKGSVEKVLARCADRLAEDGSSMPLDVEAYHAQADDLASQGLRVLALAQRRVGNEQRQISHDDVAEGLTFLGLQAMMDPPREGVAEAVAACRSAGIDVKMITGDHALTALAIARLIGIEDREAPPDGPPLVLRGQEITNLSDEELAQLAPQVSVFARVAPEDKLRLVRALQQDGDVIAMTGDGVNDAPSLRQANIGIAMGITGTDVAKETADMVLTDDNFATIEAAVEEGRSVYDNIVKFITWTLPTNFGEGLVILIAIVLGTTLPILPVQILWINMTTAVLLGLTLAFEPQEPGLMKRPPRKAGSRILSGPLIERIVLTGSMLCAGAFGLFEWAEGMGRSEEEARTLAVNVFVLGEMFYLFNCRSLRYSVFKIGFFSNPYVLGGVGLMLLLQLGFTYLPFMQAAFGTAAIGWLDWAYLVLVGLGIYLVIGLEKWLRRWWEARPGQRTASHSGS